MTVVWTVSGGELFIGMVVCGAARLLFSMLGPEELWHKCVWLLVHAFSHARREEKEVFYHSTLRYRILPRWLLRSYRSLPLSSTSRRIKVWPDLGYSFRSQGTIQVVLSWMHKMSSQVRRRYTRSSLCRAVLHRKRRVFSWRRMMDHSWCASVLESWIRS